jgi:hypothetical protein
LRRHSFWKDSVSGAAEESQLQGYIGVWRC